jgi:hypothetical protein
MRSLGIPRLGGDDNIKMDLHEVGWGFGNRMELTQHKDKLKALVSTIKNFRVP